MSLRRNSADLMHYLCCHKLPIISLIVEVSMGRFSTLTARSETDGI